MSSSKKRVLIIGRSGEEANKGAALLRRSGHPVEFLAPGPELIRSLKQEPPAALVIDMSRAPSQGRDLALYLRKAAATRHIPLVMVEGGDIRKHLPDVVVTGWSRIRGAVRKAIREQPDFPVVPGSVFAGYAGTPLWKKLGIKKGCTVCLIKAPGGFESQLGDTPEDVTFRRQARGDCDLVIWFVSTVRDLEERSVRLGKLAGKGGLWIAWPKKRPGLNQATVRKVGLASGLVDYKICSIDESWSALRFTRRKTKD